MQKPCASKCCFNSCDKCVQCDASLNNDRNIYIVWHMTMHNLPSSNAVPGYISFFCSFHFNGMMVFFLQLCKTTRSTLISLLIIFSRQKFSPSHVTRHSEMYHLNFAYRRRAIPRKKRCTFHLICVAKNVIKIEVNFGREKMINREIHAGLDQSNDNEHA